MSVEWEREGAWAAAAAATVGVVVVVVVVGLEWSPVTHLS